MDKLHQIAALGRGALEVEHQLTPATATRCHGLHGVQPGRLQGVAHHLQHLLQIGAILAADLQPVVVLARFAAQPARQHAKAELAQQGMSPGSNGTCCDRAIRSRFD
ncbi:hypothetical protein D3C79_609480 [compost metagenome]